MLPLRELVFGARRYLLIIAMSGIRFTSQFYFLLARRIWIGLLIVSTLSLLSFRPEYELSPRTVGGDLTLALFAIFTVILLSRAFTLDALCRLDQMRSAFLHSKRRYQKVILVVIGLFALADVGLRVFKFYRFHEGASTNALVIVAVAFVVVGVVSFRNLRRNIAEKKIKDAEVTRSPVKWVENRNFQIFLVAIAPMVSSGLLVLLSAHAIAHTKHSSPWIYFIVGFAGLLAASPPREHFIVLCKRCGAQTSRALETSRLCPRCMPHVFSEPKPQSKQ